MLAHTNNLKQQSTRLTIANTRQKQSSTVHSRSGPGSSNNSNNNNSNSGYSHLHQQHQQYHHQQQQQQKQQQQGKAQKSQGQQGTGGNPGTNPKGLTKLNQSYSDSFLHLYKPQESLSHLNEIARPHLGQHHNQNNVPGGDKKFRTHLDPTCVNATSNNNGNENDLRLRKPTKSNSVTHFYANDLNRTLPNKNNSGGKGTKVKCRNKSRKIATNSSRLIQLFPHKFCSDSGDGDGPHQNHNLSENPNQNLEGTCHNSKEGGQSNHHHHQQHQQQQQQQHNGSSNNVSLQKIVGSSTSRQHQQLKTDSSTEPPTSTTIKQGHQSYNNGPKSGDIVISSNGIDIDIDIGGSREDPTFSDHNNLTNRCRFLIKTEPYIPSDPNFNSSSSCNLNNNSCPSSSEVYPQYPKCTQSSSSLSSQTARQLKQRTAQDIDSDMLTAEMLKKPLSLMEQKKLQWAREKEELNGLWSPWGRPDPHSNALNISGTGIMNTTTTTSTYLNKQQSSTLQSECHLPPIPNQHQHQSSAHSSLSSRSGHNNNSSSNNGNGNLFHSQPPPQGPKSLWTTSCEVDKGSVAMRLSRKTGLPLCINADTGEVHYNNTARVPGSQSNHSSGGQSRGQSSPQDDAFHVNSALVISSNNHLNNALTTSAIKYDYHQHQQNKVSSSTLSLSDGKQTRLGQTLISSTNTTKSTGSRKGGGGGGGGGGPGWTSSLDEEAFTSSGYQSEANGFLSNGEDYGYHSRNGSGDGPRCDSTSTRKSESPSQKAVRRSVVTTTSTTTQSQSGEEKSNICKVSPGTASVITQEDYRNALSSSGSGSSKNVVVHNINVERSGSNKRSLCHSPPFQSQNQHEGQGDSPFQQHNNKTKNNTSNILNNLNNHHGTTNNVNTSTNNSSNNHQEKSRSKGKAPSKMDVASQNFKNQTNPLNPTTPAAMRSSIPVGLDSATHTDSYKNLQKMEKEKWLNELEKQREEQRLRKQMEKDEKRPKWGDKGVGVGHFWDPSSVDDHLPQPSREDLSTAMSQHQIHTPAWLEKGLSRIQNSVSQPSLYNPNSNFNGQPPPSLSSGDGIGLGSSNPSLVQGLTHTQSTIDLRNVVGLGDYTESENINERNYLRGQNVPADPDISAEKEKKRRAALEHQEAIRKQIEERQMRLKQEKEKRLQEEQADEEKIKMQRLRELEQLELETRKLGYYNSGDDPDDLVYEYNDTTEVAEVRRALDSRESLQRIHSGRRLSLDGSPLIGILSDHPGGQINDPNYLTNSQSMVNISRHKQPQQTTHEDFHQPEIEDDHDDEDDGHAHSDNVHLESRPMSNHSGLQRSRSLSHHREIGIQTETGCTPLGSGDANNNLSVNKNSHKHRSHNCLMKGGGGLGGSRSKLIVSTGEESSENTNNHCTNNKKKLEKPRWGATQSKKQYVKQSEKDPLYQQRLKRRMDRIKRFEDRINGGEGCGGGGGGSSGGGGPGFSGDTGTGTESEEHSSSNNNNNNKNNNSNNQNHGHNPHPRTRGRSPPPGRFRTRSTIHNNNANNSSTSPKKQGPLKATARIPMTHQSQPPVSTRSSTNPSNANASNSSSRAKKIFPDIPGRTIGPLKPDFDGIIGSYGLRGHAGGRADGGESSANSNSSRFSSPSLDLDSMSLSSKNVQTHTHSYYLQEERSGTGTGCRDEYDGDTMEVDLESRIVSSSCRSVEIHYEDTRSVKSTDSLIINSTCTSTTTSKNNNPQTLPHKATIIEESSDEITYRKTTSTSKTVISGPGTGASAVKAHAKAKAKMMAEDAQDFIDIDMDLDMDGRNTTTNPSRSQRFHQKQQRKHQKEQQQNNKHASQKSTTTPTGTAGATTAPPKTSKSYALYDGYENDDYNDDNDENVTSKPKDMVILPKIVTKESHKPKSKRKPMPMTMAHSPSSVHQSSKSKSSPMSNAGNVNVNLMNSFGPNSIPNTSQTPIPNQHFSITNRLGSPPVPALLKKLQAGIPIEDFGVCDDLLYEIPRAQTAGSSSNSAGYKSAESDTSHNSGEAAPSKPKSKGNARPPLISRSRLSSSGGLEIDINPNYELSSIQISSGNHADDTSNILSPPSPANYYASAEDHDASTSAEDHQNHRSNGHAYGHNLDLDSNYPDGDHTDHTKDDTYYEDNGPALDLKDPYYGDEESVRNATTSFEEDKNTRKLGHGLLSYVQGDSSEIDMGIDLEQEVAGGYDDGDYVDDTYNDSFAEVEPQEMHNSSGHNRNPDGDENRDRDGHGDRHQEDGNEDEDHEEAEEADEEEEEEEEEDSASVSVSVSASVGGETGVKVKERERDLEFYGEPIYPYPIPLPKHVPALPHPSPSPQFENHRSSPTTTVPARPRVSGRTTTLEVMADYRSFHLPDYDYDNLKLIPQMEIGSARGSVGDVTVQNLRRPSTQDTDLSKREKLISYVINNKDVQAQISARDSELSEKGIIEFNVRLPSNPDEIYGHVQGHGEGQGDSQGCTGYDNYKDPLLSERRRATIRWLYSSDSSSASNHSSKDSVLAHLSYLKKGIQQQQQEWNVIPSDTEDTAEESLSRSHHHSGSTVDISSEGSKYSTLS